MECDNPNLVVPGLNPVTYKDMLTGGSANVPDDDLISLDDDDIDLLDDDVRTREMDGVPFIDFSDRVKDLAVKSMDFTLVLKVLGRCVGYTTLYNRIISLWKPTHQIKLIDIENDHFLVKFASLLDFIHALTDGPWTIFRHYITVEPWSVDFSPLQDHPSRIMVWVRLPGLPITWYKRSLIAAIGARIGQVVKIDYQTDYGRRGRFARMAIKVNLRKPLVSKIVINGLLQVVEYESLPVVCFNCGVYGHNIDLCPCNKNDEDNLPPKPRKSIAVDSTDNSFPLQQSRYNPIFLDNDNTEALVAQADLVTVPIPEQAHDTAAPHSTEQNNVSIQLTHSIASPIKLKAKWKLPQAARKPTTLNLGLKSVNILTRKYGSSTPGSSHYTTGRSQAASLHSEKHAAVELDPSAAPITLVGNSLRMHNTIKNSEAKSHPTITNDVLLLAKKSLPGHGLIGSLVSSAVQTASGYGVTIMVE
ncbi:hypothetical protein GQ457_13G016790 [Hibiscus cannabinus]